MPRPTPPPRSRRPASGRGPVQLELFGAPGPGLRTPHSVPARPAAGAPRSPSSPPLERAGRSAAPTAPRTERQHLTAGEADERRWELVRRLELLRHLNRLTGGKLSGVSLHDNRRIILSVKAERSGVPAPFQLRIHRSFLAAPEEVVQAVAVFVQSRKGTQAARESLDVIREHFHRYRPAEARKVRLEPLGVCFDLREILADLNDRFFAGRLEVGITWGRSLRAGSCGGRRRHRTSTIQLGSYAYEEKLVRLHRALDHPSVPRYVVEAVVYHELLHADLPPVTVNGRHHFHTPEFRRRERLFRHLAKTEAWIEENLPALLRRRDPKAQEGRRR